MKYVLILTAALLTGSAFADSIDVSNLTPAQVEELRHKAAEYKQYAHSDEITPQKVSEWADLGTHVGQALVGASKELGVAANDFSQTSIGKVTIAIILWKLLGKSIFAILFVPVWLSAVGIVLWKTLNRLVFDQRIYEDIKEGKVISRKITYGQDWDGGVLFGCCALAFIATIPAWIILGAFL